MGKRIISAWICSIIFILSACTGLFDENEDLGDGSENDNPPVTIEVAGSWSGTDDVSDFVYTLQNNSFSSVYTSNDSISGNVVTFDNETNTAILFFTQHYIASIVGQYGRIEWTDQLNEMITVQAFETYDFISEAQAATTVVWGPYDLTKI
jgi:hypothetical protein